VVACTLLRRRGIEWRGEKARQVRGGNTNILKGWWRREEGSV